MKIRVSRFMRGGTYFVSFQSVDVTAEDMQKASTFGHPVVQILVGNGPRNVVPVPILGLNPSQTAGFNSAADAETYEQRILNEVRASYEALRAQRDEFTGTREVEL